MNLVLCGSLHDHDLPGQVPDDAGLRQHRVLHTGEVLHLETIIEAGQIHHNQYFGAQ